MVEDVSGERKMSKVTVIEDANADIEKRTIEIREMIVIGRVFQK